jgi:hypothetical protein
MALSLCSCGRHVRTSERACPFCGAAVVGDEARAVPGRRSRAAALVCVAALGVACAARTELGATPGDASSESGADASTSDANADARDDNAITPIDVKQPPLDAIDECLGPNEPCTQNSECCDGFCGGAHVCDMNVPPYGSPPPED